MAEQTTQQRLIALGEETIAERAAAGGAFTNTEVARNRPLQLAAYRYLLHYSGPGRFLADIHRRAVFTGSDGRPRLDMDKLSIAQIRATVNIMVAQAKQVQVAYQSEAHAVLRQRPQQASAPGQLVPSTDGERQYLVTLEPRGCTCRGFTSHGHCKHLSAALQAAAHDAADRLLPATGV